MDFAMTCDIHEDAGGWTVVSRQHGHVAKRKAAAAALRSAQKYFAEEQKHLAGQLPGRQAVLVRTEIAWHPTSDVGRVVANAIAVSDYIQEQAQAA